MQPPATSATPAPLARPREHRRVQVHDVRQRAHPRLGLALHLGRRFQTARRMMIDHPTCSLRSFSAAGQRFTSSGRAIRPSVGLDRSPSTRHRISGVAPQEPAPRAAHQDKRGGRICASSALRQSPGIERRPVPLRGRMARAILPCRRPGVGWRPAPGDEGAPARALPAPGAKCGTGWGRPGTSALEPRAPCPDSPVRLRRSTDK